MSNTLTELAHTHTHTRTHSPSSITEVSLHANGAVHDLAISVCPWQASICPQTGRPLFLQLIQVTPLKKLGQVMSEQDKPARTGSPPSPGLLVGRSPGFTGPQPASFESLRSRQVGGVLVHNFQLLHLLGTQAGGYQLFGAGPLLGAF